MHHVTHVCEKRNKNSASPPPDHCGTLHPNAGRRPCKKEKAPCTSTPCSHTRNDKIVRHGERICLTSRFSVSFFLDCFCPPLIPRRRRFESMRRAVYQWRRLALRFYSSWVFPRLVLATGGSGLYG